MSTTVTSVAEEHQFMPREVVLEQNYPNPFNPTTTISYQLPALSARQTVGGLGVEGTADSFVRLKVFDVLGREVASLVNEVVRPGVYIARWDGSARPSGVYFYHLEVRPSGGGQTGDFTATRKMILIR
jgi:hypothetical protein